jgi:Spy/CpxP family protein refolding chaperone
VTCGVLIGAIGALVLFKLVKLARYGGCGGWRHHHRRGHHRGGGWLRWIFEDLDTSPGQEKNIEETVEGLREKARDTRGEFKKSLDDLVAALTSDEFDHERVGEAWVKQDKALDSIRLAAIEALGKIHETLDPRQRERLAEIIRSRV